MNENQHEVIIRGNERFVGTGHNSDIVEDDSGKTWIFYHAIDKNDPKGRKLMLDEVQWKDGWPHVEGNSPSHEWKAPVFKN